MMKKPRKSPLGILKIALLIPAVLVTLGLTTGMTPQQKTVKGKVVFADTGEPATGTSVVIRHGTTGCVVDKDGSFMLNVDGDPELVFSFVGYESLIVKTSDIGKKPLELKVMTYTMDLESVPLEVKKDPSGTISLKLKDGSEAQPVFVVDGDQVVGSVEDIDPDDIESISVIKDPEDPLVKKYNATDGLILITTKDKKAEEEFDKETSASIILIQKNGAEAHPVYIVDGKQVDEIESLNSDLIDKVSVIKDPDSPEVKKYNAKDGVILITTKEAAAASKDEEEMVFYIVEDMPQFPGGKTALKTYIDSNLQYPEKAKSQGTEGKVYVQWTINTQGQTKDVKVLQSTNPVFDEAAMKVIREMPKWKPGSQRGKAVSVQFNTKINFTLPKK